MEKLVEQARECGPPGELRVEGDPVELSAGVDLTAYRLVQEGLTNATKHARAEHAEVLVRYGDGRVELTVADDGRGDGGGEAAATASSACASESRFTAASSMRARGRRAATGFARTLPVG